MTPFVISNTFQPLAILGQVPTDGKDIYFLEWVFLPHTSEQTVTTHLEMCLNAVTRGRQRTSQILG